MCVYVVISRHGCHVYDEVLRVFVDSVFFFQAEDGIRDAQESRGLGDVYKRQALAPSQRELGWFVGAQGLAPFRSAQLVAGRCARTCLLYTSDAADDLLCVDLGGRRIIKKKTQMHYLMNLHKRIT